MKEKIQERYSIKELLTRKSLYNLILGQRSNGKSYQVKHMSLTEAYTGLDYITHKPLGKRRFLAYIRRWKEELKTGDVESYFDDMPISEITKGDYDCVAVWRSDIFFARLNKETGKKERGMKIGHCFCLTSATHYKSLMFPDILNLIFEEFLTDMYLPREVENLESIVSTIARADEVHVYMIGNTISRLCPYFREWELTNCLKQKQGTIDIYKKKTPAWDPKTESWIENVVLIAVEYCRQNAKTGIMSFGRASHSINGGEWECDEQPHLPKKFNEYNLKYKILFKSGDFAFMVTLLQDKEKRELTLYCYPAAENSSAKRIVSDDYSMDRFHTNHLTALTKYDKIVIDLLNVGKICFSDNLTGTEFYTLLNNRKGGF